MEDKVKKAIEKIDLQLTAIGNKKITEFVSTGSDLLDIITGGGYEKGTVVNIIGDSSAGKTLIAAEAVYQAKLRYKNKVRCRYLDKESGFKFDTMAMYDYDIREDIVTGVSTIQDFAADYGLFVKKLKPDEFGFYIVDSFDSLCSDADIEEFDARVKDYEKGKSYSKGTMDMTKQKYSSKFFRTISDITAEKNVILILISQIRDNVGEFYGTKWKVSGGKAMQFYCSLRLFLKRKEDFKIVGTDRIERSYGYSFEARALKSRCKWPNRFCNVNILYETGLDNTSSNIDYLFNLKDTNGKLNNSLCKNIQWKTDTENEVTSETIKEFIKEHNMTEELKNFTSRATLPKMIDFINSEPDLLKKYVDKFGVMDRDSLVNYIEGNNLEDMLSRRVRNMWLKNEEAIKQKRKRKVLK